MTLYFYRPDKKLGELSNFFKLSAPLVYEGKPYPTSEHLYQALKFLGPDASEASRRYAEAIRQAKTPGMAKIIASQKIGGGYAWRVALNPIIQESLAAKVQVRADWETVKIECMHTVLQLKFQQNSPCRTVLLSTGNVPLAEQTSRDAFWGDGDGTGQNHLGKLLVRVRTELRVAAKRKFSGDVPEKRQRSVPVEASDE